MPLESPSRKRTRLGGLALASVLLAAAGAGVATVPPYAAGEASEGLAPLRARVHFQLESRVPADPIRRALVVGDEERTPGIVRSPPIHPPPCPPRPYPPARQLDLSDVPNDRFVHSHVRRSSG